MDIEKYDGKHVRITDLCGNIFVGLANYSAYGLLMHEYGGNEDGIFIEDILIYNSQINSIEEIELHGTVELQTEHLTLRRYRSEDVKSLHRYWGMDSAMHQYSAQNPYATLETARETVNSCISGYNNEHFYSWLIDFEDVLIGAISACDYTENHIEIGFSVMQNWREHGYAEEALKKVLEYLTENEGICRVTARCAAENTESGRILQRAGMKLTHIEKNGLKIGERVYDKITYEYRQRS